MKTLVPFALVPLWFCISATTPDSGRTPPAFQTGTYGVCGCAEEAPGAVPIALTIREDGSFHYVDGSDPAHPIDQNGQWQMKGRKLVLRSGHDEQTWTLDRDQPCVRTRFGMRFERLCHKGQCE